MAEKPQQHEVGIDLTAEHALQIELHVGLAGQARVIPKQAQSSTIAHDCPQVIIGTIQELLHKAVRRDTRGAGNAFGARIERDTGSDEMNRNIAPRVTNRIRLALDLDGGCGLHLSKAELLKQS